MAGDPADAPAPGQVRAGAAASNSTPASTAAPQFSLAPPAPLAWIDGRFVPATAAMLPVGDAGFVLGVTVTEQMRSFAGGLFLADEHAARFGRSLATVGITIPYPLQEVFAAAAKVAQSVHAAGRPEDDVGVIVFATPGDLAAQHSGKSGPPRVVAHAFPLAFGAWAGAYEAGVSLRSVTVEQVPAACWPLALKCRSRMHYYLADREAHAAEPGARAILRHADGRISETATANVAIVRGGVILTPPAGEALAGVSLHYLRGLAATEGVPWQESSLLANDLATADEILLSSTPSCLLPATGFDGKSIGTGRPGPMFRRLLNAWSRGVGLDIAAQARAILGDRPRAQDAALSGAPLAADPV